MGAMGAGRNSKKDGAGTTVRTGDQRITHVDCANPSRDLASAEPAGLAPAKTDTPPHSTRPADAASAQTGILPHSMRPAGLAPAKRDTLPPSARPADAAFVQTDILPHSKRPAGGCGALPRPWESLCPDVRQIILSKVPLRDLAPGAATCREFRAEFRRRLGEEHERLIAVAEERYGKDRVSGFLKSVQQIVCGRAPDHGIVIGHEQFLLIHAAGDPELVTRHELDDHIRNGPTTHYWRGACWGHLVMMPPHVEGRRAEGFGVSVQHWLSGRRIGADGRPLARLEAAAWADEANVGVLLALCTRNPEPMPAQWESASKAIHVAIWGWEGGEVKAKFQGSLGSLANAFFLRVL